MNFCSRWLAALSLVFLVATQAAAQHVDLLGFGDWGVDAPERQKVADAMAVYSANSVHPIDAALSLGDNFYVPLHSADDPIFQKLFENTYDVKRMNFPFFALIGNHDYDPSNGRVNYQWEMAYAATHPDSRWKMPTEYYRLDLPTEHPIVTILMLNSNHDGISKQGAETPAEWSEQMQWLTRQLAGPRAAWTLCCAHHTVYSNGNKGDNGVLIEQWGALFQKYKVDMYLSGHNHSLQHLETPGIFTSFVVSGGGGAKRDAMLRDNRGPFSKSISGFAALSFEPEMVTVRLLDGDGKQLHEFTRSKAGEVTVTQNTASDPRPKHPLKVVQGIDDSMDIPASQPAH